MNNDWKITRKPLVDTHTKKKYFVIRGPFHDSYNDYYVWELKDKTLENYYLEIISEMKKNNLNYTSVAQEHFFPATAIIIQDSGELWSVKNGKFHNDLGPAYIHPKYDGNGEYWIDGKQMTQIEFCQARLHTPAGAEIFASIFGAKNDS